MCGATANSKLQLPQWLSRLALAAQVICTGSSAQSNTEHLLRRPAANNLRNQLVGLHLHTSGIYFYRSLPKLYAQYFEQFRKPHLMSLLEHMRKGGAMDEAIVIVQESCGFRSVISAFQGK